MSEVVLYEDGIDFAHQQITGQFVDNPASSTTDNTNYPLHYAASHSCVSTFKYLVEKAVSLGDSTESELIMRLRDDAGFTPLHSAVSGGSKEVVECCLLFGCSVELTENTGCTALHMSCSQGCTSITEVLLNNGNVSKVIDFKDIGGQTALHLASKYNHVDVARLLIQNGCKLDEKDNDGFTPLLIASLMSCWQTSWLLMEHKANLADTDVNGRNIMHLFVYKTSAIFSIPKFLCEKYKEDLLKLVNRQDIEGNSPLHVAVLYGDIIHVQQILDFGASQRLRNNQCQTPFHIAAAIGRCDCINVLMNYPSSLSINQIGADNKRAVHQAAANGHVEVVKILLRSGAITRGDMLGQNPFHAAAKGGHIEVARVLLKMRSKNVLNDQDKNGNTALHLAAIENQPHMVSYLLTEGATLRVNFDGDYFFDVVTDNRSRNSTLALTIHDRWHECLSMYNKSKGLPMIRLIMDMPSAAKIVLDRSKETADIDPKNLEYWIKYDFRYLCPDASEKDEIAVQPLEVIDTMIKFTRTELLGHQVCEKYLNLKWETYGIFTHTIQFTFYILYVIIYTYFILSVEMNKFDCKRNNGTEECTHIGNNEFTDAQFGSLICLMIYSSVSFLVQIKILLSWGNWRVMSVERLIKIGTHVVVAIFAGPLLFQEEFSYHWQWEFGILGLFLGWTNTMQLLKRTSPFGILIMMFYEVLVSMLKIITVFSLQLFGLAVCFHALLGSDEDQPFESFIMSCVRIYDMMIGEIDFINSFAKPVMDGSKDTAHYQWTIIILVLIFMITMTIALMNLMIGLAVGDIEKIGKMAKYHQHVLSVGFYKQFEITFNFYKKYFQKHSLTVYPNRKEHRQSMAKMITWLDGLFGNIPVLEDAGKEDNNGEITIPTEARIFKRIGEVNDKLNVIIKALNKLESLKSLPCGE